MNTKTSMVLTEVILSIALFSIVLVYSLNSLVSIYEKNDQELLYTTAKLKLETTRLFILKNNNFSKIIFDDETLYYDNKVLLDNVQSFNIEKDTHNIYTINITLDNITQNWKLK
ncbi:MAG: hypothetical protein U9Q04_09990 [Campylobacterota bacterium]|nr:hypothetical protein [Campylobacterota bacterium]